MIILLGADLFCYGADASFNEQLDSMETFYQGTPPAPADTGRSVSLSDLPSPLQHMIEQANTDFLDQVFTRLNNLLNEEAADLYRILDFIPASGPGVYGERLEKTIQQASSLLILSERALDDLYHYLDWYGENDWQQRFGVTGFYERIRQMRRSSIVYHAILTCYQTSLCTWRGECDKQISRVLKDRLTHLEEYYESFNTKSDLIVDKQMVGLWMLRLERLLAAYEPSTIEALNRHLQSIKRLSLPADLEYEYRLESLRCGALIIDDQQIWQKTKLITAIRQNISWLHAHKEEIKKYPQCLLQIYLFEYKLDSAEPGDFAAREKLKMVFNRLYSLDRQYPQCHDFIQAFIVGTMTELFEGIEPSDDATDRFTQSWGDYELLVLGSFYLTAEPAHYPEAITLYKSFLRTRPAANTYSPLVLYCLGYGHYRLGIAHGLSADEQHSIRTMTTAIRYWIQLAVDYPQWSITTETLRVITPLGDGLDSSRAADQAGSLAYYLYTIDPEQNTDLILRSLKILVGEIKPGHTEPEGIYAHTETARKYRYYYALILQAGQQYLQAAAMFSAVPGNDEHKFTARYYAALNRYQHESQMDLSRSQLSKEYQPLISELFSLISECPEISTKIKALYLAIQLSLEAEQTEVAVENTARLLEIIPWDDSWVKLILNLLGREQTVLLQYHAQDDTPKLEQSLKPATVLAQKLYSFLKDQPEDEMYPSALRFTLEYMVLCTLHSNVKECLCEFSEVRSLLETADRAEGAINQLWLTRCRALLAFAEGRYQESQEHWYRIRQSLQDNPDADDEMSRYLWWEARIFGLRCLLARGQSEEAAHVIEVVLRTHPDYHGPWRTRLEQLKIQAGQKE